MKEKLSIIVSGLCGISSLAFAIYGLTQSLDRHRYRAEDFIFVAVLFISGVSVIYTSSIAWKLLKNLNFSDTEKSLLSLKAQKTRLLLEKEIRELEAENEEFKSKNSN